MTISNGSNILETDLETAFAVTSLRSAKAAALKNAGVYQINLDFPAITSGLSSSLRSVSFTVPDDDQRLLAIGGRIIGTTGAYSLTITGPLVKSISLSQTTSSSPEDITRYVANSGDEPLQVFLRGATYTVTANAPATGTNYIRAFLLFQLLPRRR